MYHIKLKNNQNHSIISHIIRKHTRKILKYTYGIENEHSSFETWPKNNHQHAGRKK